MRVTIITVLAKPRGAYEGYDMYLGSVGDPGDVGESLIGHKPYDGSSQEQAESEVIQALAGMLRERLGWRDLTEDEEYREDEAERVRKHLEAVKRIREGRY